MDLSSEAARKRMERQFQDNAGRALFSRPMVCGSLLQPLKFIEFTYIRQQEEAEVLPHVYSSSGLSQNNVLSHTGQRYLLPLGTERKDYEVCQVDRGMGSRDLHSILGI
jgi:antiviral helicase SLH1